MRLIATLLEGIGTSRFVEGRSPMATPGETPSRVAPTSPPTELDLLERRALEKGISSDELTKTRRIGDCPAQVRARIEHLHQWLAAH